MALRHRCVRLAGLRDPGRIADAGTPRSVRAGEPNGSFTVPRNEAGQGVPGDSDRPPAVALSPQATVPGAVLHGATVLERADLFGRRYMRPSAPIQRVIVPRLPRRYAHRLRDDAAIHHPAGDGPTPGSPS